MKSVRQSRVLSFLNTIRGRLVLLAVLALIPALAVQAFGGWRDLRGDIEARKLESSRALTHATGDFAALLAETRTVTADLVRINEVRSPGNCTQVFTALRFAYERLAPEAVNLGLADAEGRIYCAINPLQGQRSLAGAEAFRSAVATSDMATSSYAPNLASGPPQILVASPVLSFDGQLQTVIFVTFATRWLERWQSESALPPGSAITLLAADGTPVWRAVDGQPVPLGETETQGVAWLPDLRAGGPAMEGPDLDGVERLHTVVPLQHQGQSVGYLHLGYPLAQLYTDARRELGWQLALLSLVLAGTLAVAWQGSERFFLGPLRDLMAAVQRVQAGDLSARVAAVRGLGEVAELARAFDRMADALQQREAERRQIEARFRAAFESSAIGMGLLTLDGWILAANAAVCQMSGFTEEELKQRNDRDNVYPPDAAMGMDLFAEMLAGKRGYYSVEKRYLRKNGAVFWVRLTLSLVRDAFGNPAYLVGMVEDIDEQKRESAALAESEARFKAIFDNAAIGISLIASDGRVLAVNPVLQQLAGRSEAELMALGGQAITYPEDQDVGRKEFAEVMAGERDAYQVEKRYVHADGRVQWMRQSVSPVRDASGKVLYLVVIAEDIDKRKRTLEELRASEARFKAVFDNAAVGVALMTLDRRIVQINPTVTRITGYSPAEMYSINPTDMVVEEDRLIDRELFLELVAGQRDQYLVEKRYRRRDGSLFWGRINFALVRDEQDEPHYIVGMIEDITEERAARQTLAESEARFRTLYDSAEMGIVLMDLGRAGNLPLDEARFKYLVANQRLNPAMLRMFGYTAEDLQRTPIISLIYPEDHGIDAQQFRQLLTGEIDSYRIEKRFVRKDGSVFWGRLTDSLARAADGTPQMVIGIIEDISEERRAEERLAHQEAEHRRQLEQRITERTEELSEANERLREKAAQDAVAAERTRLARDLHDAVTQTLFSTTLIAEVLPDLWALDPAEGRRRLEELRQLTRGALAEMRTLLVELRPNALTEVPLPTLLRQLSEGMVSRARISIQLNAEGERKLPADVQVGLYRIAQEALSNVTKHAKATQAIVTLRLGETVRLTVADNGAGFDPGAVAADHLGLRIMRERAEAIGARLSVYSEPGEGTQISAVWGKG